MSDRSLGGLPITGWLAIVLAMVGVLVWKQVPLDPKRAAGTDVQGAQVRALQDVNARLWEDPYAAVARARRGDEEARALVVATGACANPGKWIRAPSRQLRIGFQIRCMSNPPGMLWAL